MTEIESFYEELHSDVVLEAKGTVSESGELTGADFKENAFTRLVVDDLSAAGVMEAPTTCFLEEVSGNLVSKVNAYGIPEDDSRLDLVVTAFYADETPRRLQGADLERLYASALRYLQSTVKGKLHERLEPGSERFSMTREIYERREEFDRVQIILITNGISVQRKDLRKKEKVEGYSVNYDIWDLERLRRFRSSGATHEPISVDLGAVPGGGVPCVAVADDVAGFRTCLAIIPGSLLHDWYDEYGSRMLELNVRSYLQARGKINSGILETIIREPERFLSYNNGITIVAEEVAFSERGDRITRITGLQIVNGGQTTASIHKAKRENKADLSRIFVQAKITIVPAEIFEIVVPDISRFSNTQNKVTEVDLGANHAFHVGVERVALNTWAPGEQTMWFYERARGSYQVQRSRAGSTKVAKDRFDARYPAFQRISKEDLARYWNTWAGFAPTVNRGGQKNFVRFMESLPTTAKGWEPGKDEFREIVAKAILFKNTQEIAKRRKISAFGINIVIYTVAVLAERTARRVDLLAIWNAQRVSPELEVLIGEWLDKVAALLKQSAGDKNPGEWFKQESCWKYMKDATASWSLPKVVSAQLRTANGIAPSAVSDEVHNAIAQCMQVEAATWFQIQVWGRKTGQLQSWQTGIANTLSGYAANGWIKKPSVKQATQAVRIIEIYTSDPSRLIQ